jgi:nucleotidyltransferase substrate binding protein (TIGR01987 family)
VQYKENSGSILNSFHSTPQDDRFYIIFKTLYNPITRALKIEVNYMKQDIRWIQRLSNFSKALAQLSKFIIKSDLNELERQGLIQSFEYNFELAWNTIKDFYESQGETTIQGSRDAFRIAFKRGLIEHGEIWMEMVTSRTLTTHTYNEATALEISSAIISTFYPELIKLQAKLMNIKQNEQSL